MWPMMALDGRHHESRCTASVFDDRTATRQPRSAVRPAAYDSDSSTKVGIAANAVKSISANVWALYLL